MKKLVLTVVEDPGAANMVRDLPGAMARRGAHCKILTFNHATAYLRQRQVAVEPWNALTPEELLAIEKPDLVLVGSSDNPDSKTLALVLTCRRKQIPSVGLVDMRMNADKRFKGRSDNNFAYLPDFLIVPDDNCAEDYCKLGVRPERVFALGNPQFDLTAKRAQELLAGQDSNSLKQTLFGHTNPVITFVAEPGSTLDPESTERSGQYHLHGTTGSKSRCLIVLEELLAALARNPDCRDVQVVIRLHPRNDLDDFLAYKDRFSLHQGGEPLELICASDLTVGMTSMLLLEAAIAGTATICIVPNLKEADWLPTVAAGVTPCATTSSEIDKALSLWKSGALKPSSKSWFNPGALDRIAEFITQTLEIEKNV